MQILYWQKFDKYFSLDGCKPFAGLSCISTSFRSFSAQPPFLWCFCHWCHTVQLTRLENRETWLLSFKKKKERKKEKEKEKKKMQERTVVLGLKLDHYWLYCLSPQNWEVCLCNILIKNFRFLLNCFVREIKGFYQSSLGNEVDYRDIINVSPNILAKN